MNRRFSLIELMVVVVILGILATVVSVNVLEHLATARKTQAKTQISNFKSALEFYYIDNHKYPTSSEGLRKLTEVPNGKMSGYLEVIPKDPWGNLYEYRCPTDHKYDIISFGSDAVEGGDGEAADIKSWELVEGEGK
jgi:general secretion pathway protein G